MAFISVSDAEFIDVQNLPGLVLLSASGVVGMIFVVRWMIRFQSEFTNFYVEENRKLRKRVDDLEEEVMRKEDVLMDQNRKLFELETESTRRITELEAHVAKLNKIIERRKLEE